MRVCGVQRKSAPPDSSSLLKMASSSSRDAAMPIFCRFFTNSSTPIEPPSSVSHCESISIGLRFFLTISIEIATSSVGFIAAASNLVEASHDATALLASRATPSRSRQYSASSSRLAT